MEPPDDTFREELASAVECHYEAAKKKHKEKSYRHGYAYSVITLWYRSFANSLAYGTVPPKRSSLAYRVFHERYYSKAPTFPEWDELEART
jgi:hypothetical protein